MSDPNDVAEADLVAGDLATEYEIAQENQAGAQEYLDSMIAEKEARDREQEYNEQMRKRQEEKDALAEAARLEEEKISALEENEASLNSTDRAKLNAARASK